MIEGGALQHALREDQQGHFLDLCASCTGVVCCRVSPIQKASVTSLMKERGGRVTLGVGDGANDVGMIKAAHIGVGISGREGRAAVLASDFSVGQFRFLARLLLVHGRWSAKRNREVVLYAFYKNFAYTMANVWFGFLSAYSAQPIYTTAAIATFNVLWTSLPTVAFACFDQDVVASVALAHPRLYEENRRLCRRGFRARAARWLASASWHSLWCFFVALVALGDPAASTSEGKPWDLWSAGVAAFTSVVVACTLKVAARTNHWTACNAAAVVVSVATWFPFLVLLETRGDDSARSPACTTSTPRSCRNPRFGCRSRSALGARSPPTYSSNDSARCIARRITKFCARRRRRRRGRKRREGKGCAGRRWFGDERAGRRWFGDERAGRRWFGEERPVRVRHRGRDHPDATRG